MNIVKRLREFAYISETIEESADEIERLREALKIKCSSFCVNDEPCSITENGECDALSVLQQKESE